NASVYHAASPDLNQPQPPGPAVLEVPHQVASLWSGGGGGGAGEGGAPGVLEKVVIAQDVADPQVGKTGLACAEELARSAHAQILARDRETVGGRGHDVEPPPG